MHRTSTTPKKFPSSAISPLDHSGPSFYVVIPNPVASFANGSEGPAVSALRFRRYLFSPALCSGGLYGRHLAVAVRTACVSPAPLPLLLPGPVRRHPNRQCLPGLPVKRTKSYSRGAAGSFVSAVIRPLLILHSGLPTAAFQFILFPVTKMRDTSLFHRWVPFATCLAALILLLYTMSPAVCAATGNQQQVTHFSSDAAALYQRAAQVAAPAGADVLVLEDEETIVFDNQGKARRSRYLVYKVLTQKGAEDWADVSISWEPWQEEHPDLRARVITPDNIEHPLDMKTVTDAPAKESEENVFSDRRVTRAPLPAIAPGSLVEEEETFQQTAPFFGAGTVERYYFGRSAPVRHARLILDAPSTLLLRYDLQLLPDLKPQRTESDGRLRIIFDPGPIEPLDEVESELPSDVPAYPNVTFSTGESWQEIAGEYSKIVDNQIAAAELQSVVGKLTAGRGSRDEKAAGILQYLDREIRYTGVEFGEAAVVPRAPAEILARKYGDCKDKAALLVAMLRAASIPAYVALLNAGSREDVSSDLPGMGMFDHAIVYVPGNPDLWIDATDEYARLGQLPSSDQDRLSLIARPSSLALVRTPSMSSTDNTVVEKREIRLAEYGPTRIIETSQPHGAIESSFRRSYIDKENKATKDALTRYVKDQYLAEKLDRIDRSDPNDLSKQFELVLECNRAKRGFTDLSVAVAAIRLEGLFSTLPSDLQQREKEESSAADADSGKKTKKKRIADFQLSDAFVTEWQYTIVPPAGFEPKPLPQNTSLSLGPAILREEFSTGADNVVHAAIRFDTVKRRMNISEATELRNKVAQIKAGEAILIYFEPSGEALLNEGKVREALQSYRDLVALHPKDAIHHLRIAKAFLAAGLGETARSEAHVAVGLEPNSALAEKTLAEILQYDSVGRKLRPGSDFAGAKSAYRAAIALDPSDKATVGNLAILLEYDRWGLRYGPGASLKDAVAEYRKLTPENLIELNLTNNIAFALFYAGEFPEARKEAETLNPSPTALIVACETAINGSQAGLAEARKRTGGQQPFKDVAEKAGEMLANIQKYPLAADLFEAGASGDNASSVAADAITYRKMEPHAHVLFPDDPTGTAMHFVLLEEAPEVTLDQISSIASRNGKLTLAVPELVDRLAKEERAAFSSKARSGIFADVGIDLSLARAQPRLEGNDGTGYKITLWPSASYKSSFYVIKEEGKYKLLATSIFPTAIGLEVLDRVAANDLAGARALLDWLREDEHLAGGDDPLAGTPFPRFWTKGKNTDAAVMKLAAASILVRTKETAGRGLDILEAARPSVNESEKVNIELALLFGYDNLNEYDKALAVCVDLAAQYPESRRIFLNQSFELRALGRFDEADRLAEDRLQRTPGDIDAMRALSFSATVRGDYVRAHTLGQKILTEGKAEPQDLNQIAWLSLFVGKVDNTDIEDALKATQLSQNNASDMHTLGCTYAEVGRTKKAREVLVQAMDLLNLDEPDDNYWYAFGRIAEQYGERDAAIADYNRVAKPKRSIEIPSSSYRLAQTRLQVLSQKR
jgi:tetratricopeptide (TPR) repeat protein/transglutaminase-like putative cysteine protease